MRLHELLKNLVAHHEVQDLVLRLGGVISPNLSEELTSLDFNLCQLPQDFTRSFFLLLFHQLFGSGDSSQRL